MDVAQLNCVLEEKLEQLYQSSKNPKWPDVDRVREKEAFQKERQRENYNLRYRTEQKVQSQLQQGDSVYVQDSGITGTVV